MVLLTLLPLGLRRVTFLRASIALLSRRRVFAALPGFVAMRGLGLRFFASSAFQMRSSASSRLRSCERCSVPTRTMPLGRCVIRTADSVLLRCCPPGPDAR